MILEYDGTLGGFLTLIHIIFTEKLSGYRIRRKRGRVQESLFDADFDAIRLITTDREAAHRVLSGMLRKLSRPVVNTMTKAFLSEEEEMEAFLCSYIRMAHHMGVSILNNLADPVVIKVVKASNKVFREYHRYLGLLRFRQLADGVYYAPFRPDSNILPLMPPHFLDRFSDQPWIIHDVGRGTAMIYNKKDLEEVAILDAPDLEQNKGILSAEEERFCLLWQQYHKNIGVKGRKNPKLQQQFLPRKTWEFLPEMQHLKKSPPLEEIGRGLT